MLAFFKKHSRHYPLLLIALLFIIPVIVAGLSQKATQTQKKSTTTMYPSPMQTGDKTSQYESSPKITPTKTPEERLLDKFDNRVLLSDVDQTVKSKILATSGDEEDPILYESQNVRIDYVSAADLFQAEILTANVSLAKSEAAQWFAAKGMSKEGVCNLPLSFYLSFDILQEFKQKKLEFNPLPDGC